MAAVAGVDIASWRTCFDGTDIRTSVQNATSSALGAGIDRTPTMLINDQKIVGLPSRYDDLAAYIRQLLARQPPAANTSP
jgi:predicted DsbA family dithiol-disulfide isomerase